jgi:Zn finger protein HypA/HybF (possibly regulating hydrogenase expression)
VLRAIEPENLSFLFGHLARGTPAEGARLEIVEEPIRIECAACGVSEARSFTFECPRCKGSGVSVTGGDSLSILSLDIED